MFFMVTLNSYFTYRSLTMPTGKGYEDSSRKPMKNCAALNKSLSTLGPSVLCCKRKKL